MGAHVDNSRNVWQLHQNQAAFQNALVLPTDPAAAAIHRCHALWLHPASNPPFKFRSQRPKPRLKKKTGDGDTAKHDAAANDWEWEGSRERRVRSVRHATRGGRQMNDDDKGKRAATRSTILGGAGTWSPPFPAWIFVRFPFPPAPCLYLLGYCQIPALVIWRARPLPRAAVSSSLLCPAAAPGAAAEIKGCGVTGFCES